jgi:hypothetical protein
MVRIERKWQPSKRAPHRNVRGGVLLIMRTQPAKALPKVVSAAKWQAAHEKLLAKEKAATRRHDES